MLNSASDVLFYVKFLFVTYLIKCVCVCIYVCVYY